MKVVLINPYELGRQPFALAQPAAWLKEAGHQVCCLELSLQQLDDVALGHAELVAVYVGMHTAARIAAEALPRIRALAPQAHVSVYGLYAPMNDGLFRSLGAKTVFGGEVEPHLLSLADQLSRGESPSQDEAQINLSKVTFRVPDRSTLPEISRYAHLRLGDGATRIVGFVEGSRGCKHLCRHCPVVPVYKGKFRVVPVDVVMGDIRQQVAVGAEHVSFGDPDFLNGPTHALRLAHALHSEFPALTYDATIKVEHIIKLQRVLPVLKETGCLFVISAVEAVDDVVLGHLDKNHTNADFDRAVALLRDVGISFAPTFVAFTPWTTLRVRPETLCRITEFSEHESNGRELDEGERVAVEVLPVLGQSAAAVEPGDGAFDHPTPGLDDEALHPIGSLDDLGLEIGQDAGQGAVKDRALIGAVGEQFPEKGKQTEQGRRQRETAVAILNGGGGDDAVQQHALRIDQNMPLLALDQLAGIEAVAVDASPPFSALFTL